MKINNKKFIYLISPNKINKSFFLHLNLVLKNGKVGIFQLRLKKYPLNSKILIGKKVKKICRKNRVKFLVNDDPKLAKKLNADGCHLGQSDTNVNDARSIIGNKIIGVTCHNSIKFAKFAIKAKANYLAFGAFFPSKTKRTKYHASIKNLKEASKLTKIPLVAIGGINPQNYKKLLLNKAKFLAISSYIWKNKKYKPLKAIERFR